MISPGDGGLLTRTPDPEPHRPAAEAVASKAPVETGDVQRLTGRILPDLSEETRAEEQLRQEREERAVRLRAQRGARKTRLSVEPMWANTLMGDEPDPAREAVLDPTPAAEPLSLDEPVLTVEEVGAPATMQPIPSLSVSPLDRSPGRSRLRGCRRKADQAVGRRAERQGRRGRRAGRQLRDASPSGYRRITIPPSPKRAAAVRASRSLDCSRRIRFGSTVHPTTHLEVI